jgi:hypothetical protein
VLNRSAMWPQTAWGSWVLTWPLLQKLDVTALVVATVALSFAIWDKLRVPLWDWLSPLGVRFEPKLISWDYPDPTIRFRLTVKNRVDYRARVLLGTVETWNRPTDVSVDGPILSESLQDQIDDESLGSTTGGKQLIASIEAFQRRHLVLEVKLRVGVPGILSPGATFLVGQRANARRRYRGRGRSVSVTWEGTRPVLQEVDRPSSLNS